MMTFGLLIIDQMGRGFEQMTIMIQYQLKVMMCQDILMYSVQKLAEDLGMIVEEFVSPVVSKIHFGPHFLPFQAI